MPTHHFIALVIALIALLATVTTPTPQSDPYEGSPLLGGSGDPMRTSALDLARSGSRGH